MLTYRDPRTHTRFEYQAAKWAMSATHGPHIVRPATFVVIDERTGVTTGVGLTIDAQNLSEEAFRRACHAMLEQRFAMHEHLWKHTVGGEFVMLVPPPASGAVDQAARTVADALNHHVGEERP